MATQLQGAVKVQVPFFFTSFPRQELENHWNLVLSPSYRYLKYS